MSDSVDHSLQRKLERFEHACRARGLRVTHQRSEIFKEIIGHPGHPSAEEVYKNIRHRLRTISLDTVYRTVATFEEHGLVKKVHLYDNKTRYDANLSTHHHLICSRCHKVEDFDWPDFDRLTLPEPAGAWGEIEFKHAEIQGICRECQRESAGSSK